MHDINCIQGYVCACVRLCALWTFSSLVPRPSSVQEERGRIWNITPGGSVPKECYAQVIMTRNLAFVVSHAYEECKLRSILLGMCTSSACSTFCCPFKYSGLTPCIVANQHLLRNFCLWDTSAQGYVPDPPSLFSRTGQEGLGTRLDFQ